MAVQGLLMSSAAPVLGLIPSAGHESAACTAAVAQRASGYSVWYEAVGDIDTLIHDHQYASIDTYKDITKEHWEPSNRVTCCMNSTCKKSFSLTERPHHCRRCGLVFCKGCTAYRRKLNKLAHPDPAGKQYKVCKSCSEDPQTIGAVRDLMAHFKSAKWSLMNQGAPQQTTKGLMMGAGIVPGLRNRLDAMQQCERLVKGFQQSISSSPLQWATEGLKRLVLTKKPDWKLHQNNVYEKMVPNCRRCRTAFSMLVKRQFCSTCGAATCTSCTEKDLIVFVPNNMDTSFAHWSIIKIIGCPAQEPEICMYLKVCSPCKDKLSSIQSQDSHQEAIDTYNNDAWFSMEKVFNTFSDTQRKIGVQLPKYQELIDSLEMSPGASKCPPQNKSNIQILAKAQEDLSDHFTQFVMTIHGVKSHKPPTKGQATVLRNLVKSKIQFYQDNMFTFRDLKRRLEVVTPLEILALIQGIVDHNAINSCYLLIKQLVLEVLNLNVKNKISDELMHHLTPLEEVALVDLEVSVKKGREDWEEHTQHINQLLQLQLKHHRLVKLSDSKATERTCPTTVNMEQIVGQRVAYILRKVQLQLLAKVADRSFPRTKAALQHARELVELGCVGL